MWLLKLIQKTVSIHQSAQQFGFSSSAGYMLIIVLVRLFPIHIWNLQPSRELIKLEEKYKKTEKEINDILHSAWGCFFSFCSQPYAYNALTNTAPAEQMHKAFPSIKDDAEMKSTEQVFWESDVTLPCSSTPLLLPPSSTASHQP